ncbi:hypothetical protein AVEN_267670-1 [Araneus ventricosus]|uniref:Uncharacterized protein n=1 Tax=Araneus ventricosus TaxID=182803 RepID=A0A4Y2NDF9_ARAVE|nr:hypothetical protein AVEN_267670-1 [Araneus ventricosus]
MHICLCNRNSDAPTRLRNQKGVWKMLRISAGRLNSYNNDTPPSYDRVTAADEESLPSYKEALERMLMQEAGNTSSSNSQSVLIDESSLYHTKFSQRYGRGVPHPTDSQSERRASSERIEHYSIAQQ